jgi:hypothetical protein
VAPDGACSKFQFPSIVFLMSGNPFDVLRVVKEWKPGDTREISEATLKKARLEGLLDSYLQVYDLDGKHWKVLNQVSKPTGETVYTLVCVNE